MSDTIKIKDPSPLVKTVLTLDAQFTEIEELSRKIDKMNITSDFDIRRAQQILNQFTMVGEVVTTEIANLSVQLNESRIRAEAAAQVVSDRAKQIQERKNDLQKKIEEFRILGEKVRAVMANMNELKRPSEETLPPDKQSKLLMQLSEFEVQLQPLVEESIQLRQEAQQANMTMLERQADSLSQSLIAASQKLSALSKPTLLQ